MHFVLAHDAWLRAEAFDDGADVGADAGAGDKDGELTHLGGVLEALLHGEDELLQLAGRHGEMAVGAVADHRLGEVALPLRR